MTADTWASLPTDLLPGIFRRLDAATDVVRCACACKTWRRAIIGDAASLRPRPDGFVPDLLLGFFHNTGEVCVRLLRVPSAFGSALTEAVAVVEPWRCRESLDTFIPSATASAAGVDDLSLYDNILSSRDGILLLDGFGVNGLCLCNPMTGACKLLPGAALYEAHTYVLVTDYDIDVDDDLVPSDEDDMPVRRIVAVQRGNGIDGSLMYIRYRIFSPTSGWAPIEESPDFKEYLWGSNIRPGAEVICRGGAIHWLAPSPLDTLPSYTLAMDARTGRTWTRKVPAQCCPQTAGSCVLATTRDGDLSIVNATENGRQIQVWVLGGGQWTLKRTIDVAVSLWWRETFGHRSGCLPAAVRVDGKVQMLVVDVERGTYRHIRYPNQNGLLFPYEMDWSTYLSKMKNFEF